MGIAPKAQSSFKSKTADKSRGEETNGNREKTIKQNITELFQTIFDNMALVAGIILFFAAASWFRKRKDAELKQNIEDQISRYSKTSQPPDVTE